MGMGRRRVARCEVMRTRATAWRPQQARWVLGGGGGTWLGGREYDERAASRLERDVPMFACVTNFVGLWRDAASVCRSGSLGVGL